MTQSIPGVTVPDNIDDLLIYADVAPIGYFSGQAAEYLTRFPSHLPAIARITISPELSDEKLPSVILHEMGHALGFRSRMWEALSWCENPFRQRL